MRVEEDLMHALDRGEFILHFQPIIDVRSHQLVGRRRSFAGGMRISACSLWMRAFGRGYRPYRSDRTVDSRRRAARSSDGTLPATPK